MSPRFSFSIDRGGTFTDIFATVSHAEKSFTKTKKLLSVDPDNYDDAPTEGMRRIMEEEIGKQLKTAKDVPTELIESIRMGTTVATNALLERQGDRFVLLTTSGFKDLLRIGNQDRPDIFALKVRKATQLFEEVVEVDERVSVCKGCKEGMFWENEHGKSVKILKTPNYDEIRVKLKSCLEKGMTSVAIVLIHGYLFHDHEIQLAKLAREVGFEYVSMSHEIMPMIRAVSRGFTTAVDAYLTPILRRYVESFSSQFKDNLKETNVSFMQSDGGLTRADSFLGCRAILSGPAGGYVAVASSYDGKTPVVGFDMGGTSTDVCRYGGFYDHIFETEIAGTTIQAPQLDIKTVAAGGGSRLFFRNGRFLVGPESAGAHPGPVCYRKGGYLTITDANLFLGRLLPEFFPNIFGPNQNESLDVEATRHAFVKLTAEINRWRKSNAESNGLSDHQSMSPEEVALGFIHVANETMSRPIRAMTISKGFDASTHMLTSFGGAGSQHACDIAKNLGMNQIFIHKYSGILSAVGIGMADIVSEAQQPCALIYSEENKVHIEKRLNKLSTKVKYSLKQQGFTDENIKIIYYLNLRYDRTDYNIMTNLENSTDYREQFEKSYFQQYGFIIKDRDVICDDIRVRGIGITKGLLTGEIKAQVNDPIPMKTTEIYFSEGWTKIPVFKLDELGANCKIDGPAILYHELTTILVIPQASARITKYGNVEITLKDVNLSKTVSTSLDQVQLSIFSHRFMSIAEQMGFTLKRTAISTNIKERLDFSCAIFDAEGRLIAHAPYIPIHLGSMSNCVTHQIKTLGDNWKEGEVVVSNSPDSGGTHLPDITVISPCFDNVNGQRKPVFFVASRGHHSEIGGIAPGSMPSNSHFLSEEGCILRTMKLVENYEFQFDRISNALQEADSRNIKDNLADLKAQVASNNQGIKLLNQLIHEYTLPVVHAYMGHIQDNAKLAVNNLLKDVAKKHGSSLFAVDYMDDGSKIQLNISLNEEEGEASFDFEGTSDQVYGNLNAPEAITMSAIVYCLRCMVNMDIPLNHGCLLPVSVSIPKGSLLSPGLDCAVVAGNVLTSQRVTDVIFKAFSSQSGSQGCMNNFTFGNERFGYYETIAGGAGAGSSWHGESAIHTHMTNTRITDVEIMEQRYPVLVEKFEIRPNSGGKGVFSGGNGVIRTVKFYEDIQCSLLTERRVHSPYGLLGGHPGKRGVNYYIRKDGIRFRLPSKVSINVSYGDAIEIQTPGGGGWKAPLA